VGSPRRPTYASPARRQPAAKTPPSEPDTITASKSAPAPDTASTPGRKKGKNPDPAAREKSPAASGNVLVFPEPPAKRRKRHLLVAAATVLGLVAALLAAAIFSPILAVGTITVTGTKLLTTDQVRSALEPLKGKPLPQVNDDEVGRMLEPLVQIKSVSTQARPPSELVVHVLERVPVALVKQGEQYQQVDVDGVVLATAADPASVSLPVIDGGAGTIGKDLFQATAEVLGALPADVLSKLSNASAQSVDAVELKLVDGQTIIWGNSGDKELKARVLAALLKVPADPKNPVRVYDVSAPRHPVTR
jgi:cell division protein FtsQ